MSIKHKVVKIESEYFEKSCNECKEYIDKIMKKTKDPEKTFVIYLINQGSDLSKIHNVNNAVYLSKLIHEIRPQIVRIKIYGRSFLIDSTISLVKNLLGYTVDDLVEFKEFEE